MNWKRHPDPEQRHRARRVAQMVLVLDMRMTIDLLDEARNNGEEPGDFVYDITPIQLVRRKRAWFVTAAHDSEPWFELARQLQWENMPSDETLQLARETIDAQCHILFRIDTAGMAVN